MSHARIQEFLVNIDAAMMVFKIAGAESSHPAAQIYYNFSNTLLTHFKKNISDTNKIDKTALEVFTRYFFGTAIYAMREDYPDPKLIDDATAAEQKLPELNPIFKGPVKIPDGYHLTILRVGDAYLKGHIPFIYDPEKYKAFTSNERLLLCFLKPAMIVEPVANNPIINHPRVIPIEQPEQPHIIPPMQQQMPAPILRVIPSPAPISPRLPEAPRPVISTRKRIEASNPKVSSPVHPSFFAKYKWELLAAVIGVGLIIAGVCSGGLVFLTGTAVFTLKKLLSMALIGLGAIAITAVTIKSLSSGGEKTSSSTSHVAKRLNLNPTPKAHDHLGSNRPSQVKTYEPWQRPSLKPAPAPSTYDARAGASFSV